MSLERGIKVVNGNIIFQNDCSDEKFTIKSRKYINLFINDELCKQFEENVVTKDDKIHYTLEKSEAKREINIFISEDKMKAYVRIEYLPEIEYKLKDKASFINLALSVEEVSRKYPPKYTVDEVKKILKEKNVIFGIKEAALEKAILGCNEELLIAEGEYPIQDVPSEVKLLFSPTEMHFPDPESSETIDYKNLFRISNVREGDKIAEIIPETIGKDGKNIFGEIIKKNYVRLTPITANKGCKIEENDIIATIDGKAHISVRIVTVNPVFTFESVNMETCNINFYGDIEVYDSVNDHMDVNAGGSLDVSNNVNASKVVTGGDITILGNAISSKILSGQIDIRKKEYADVLTLYKDMINDIIKTIRLLQAKTTAFGAKDFIQNLTEDKYKDFQKIALKLVTLNIKNETKGSELIEYIKEKVLGYNILKMKSLNDLTILLNILDNEIEYYDKNSIVPLDIRISYCQDCEIKSTGNIIISGKGEFTSKLTAMKDIMFTKPDSVARGGIISAGNSIAAGIVGSRAEIPTTLIVPKEGKISAVLAYRNTTFKIGNVSANTEREYEHVQVFFNKKTRLIEFHEDAF